MTIQNKWLVRSRKVIILNNRELFSALISPGFYLVAAFGSFASCMVLVNSLNYIQENGVVVFDNPLAFSVQIFVIIFSLYLGLAAATSITRERESGILETLFYGPVDEISYVLAKFLSLTTSFGIASILFSAILLLFRLLTNLHFPGNYVIILLFSLVVASNIIAVGVYISSLVRTTRLAGLLFIGVIAVILVIQLGYSYIFSLSQARYYDSFSFLKQILVFLNESMNFLSPFSFFTQGTEALQNGRVSEFAWILVRSIGMTLLLIILSVNCLRKRGVRI